MFGALRHVDYRRYFAGSVLSMMADNIEHVISYWVIFQAFHSPALAGFAVISHWVPFLLFSVWAGSLADRFDCRKLIQASQGLFMLASFGWAVLTLTGTLAMWHAVVLLIVHGMAGVVAAPAAQLIIHDMVGPALLQSAVRLNASARQLGILLGPAVGGGLMLLLGPGWGLVANILIYVPLSVYLLVVPYTGHLRGGVRASAGFGIREARGVLAAVKSDRRVLMMIVLGGATSFFVGNAFQAQMPAYAHHFGAAGAGVRYSVLLAANAAGAVVGAVLLEGFDLLRPSARTAIVCAIAWSVLMGLFPAMPTYTLAVAVLVLAGGFNIAFSAMAQTLVQLLAPPALRGRIVGFFITASLGLRAGSGVTVGLAGALIDVRRSLALSAAVMLVICVALLLAETTSAAATPATPSRPD
jgi:MFS family permease